MQADFFLCQNQRKSPSLATLTRAAIAAQGSFPSLLGWWGGIGQVRKLRRGAARKAGACLGQPSCWVCRPPASGWRCSNNHAGGVSVQPDASSEAKRRPRGGHPSPEDTSKRCRIGSLPWLRLHGSIFRNAGGITLWFHSGHLFTSMALWVGWPWTGAVAAFASFSPSRNCLYIGKPWWPPFPLSFPWRALLTQNDVALHQHG